MDEAYPAGPVIQ